MPKSYTVESLINCIGYDPEHRVYWIEKELDNGYILSVYGFSKKVVARAIRLKMKEHLKIKRQRLRGKRRRRC